MRSRLAQSPEEAMSDPQKYMPQRRKIREEARLLDDVRSRLAEAIGSTPVQEVDSAIVSALTHLQEAADDLDRAEQILRTE